MPPPNGTRAQARDFANAGSRGGNRGNGGNQNNRVPVSSLSNSNASPFVEQSLWDAFVATDKSPNTPSQAELRADPSLMTPEMFAFQQAQGGGASFLSGSAGGGGGGSYGGGGYGGQGGGSAVDRLSAARAPKGLTFSNLFGSTGYNPETGQFDQEDNEQFASFQKGLMGQLQSSQEAYQSFNPQDAASEYLRGVNAIREPLREGQTQSSLSRLIQSGKLGATAGTQALAQLESEQENQRFQEGVQATQYGAQQQDRLLQTQNNLFGLAQGVAGQQFAGQQQALGAVPLLQEINSFAEEPRFQQQLAQMGIDAQSDANDAGMWGDIFKIGLSFL